MLWSNSGRRCRSGDISSLNNLEYCSAHPEVHFCARKKAFTVVWLRDINCDDSKMSIVSVLTEDISENRATMGPPHMAALYFTRTLHIEQIGYTNEDRMESIWYRDLFRVLKRWEGKQPTQDAFKKPSSLLCHLYKCCCENRTEFGDLGPLIVKEGRVSERHDRAAHRDSATWVPGACAPGTRCQDDVDRGGPRPPLGGWHVLMLWRFLHLFGIFLAVMLRSSIIRY